MAGISILPFITDKVSGDELQHKQDRLISGTNIKTINNQSILGRGNIEVQSKQEGGSFFREVRPLANGSGLGFTLLDGTVYILRDFDVRLVGPRYMYKDRENIVEYDVTGTDDVDVSIHKESGCSISINTETKEISISPYSDTFVVSLFFVNNETGEVRIKKLRTTTASTFSAPLTLHIPPTGGNTTCNVSTNVPYYITVEGSWLNYIESNNVITFKAEPNTSGIMKSATIYFKDDFDNILQETTIHQASYIEDIIGKEFKESYSKSYTTMTGTLTFDLNSYYSNSVYTVTMCGQTLPADIDGTSLLVYDTTIKTFTFSDDYSTITGPAQFDLSSVGVYSISNYVAKLKTDEEEEEDTGDLIAGTWNASYDSADNLYSDYGTWTSATGTIKIEGASGNYTITEFLGRLVSWSLSMNGNTLSYKKDGLDLVLTYDESTGKLKSEFGKVMTDYMSFRIKNIVASK